LAQWYAPQESTFLHGSKLPEVAKDDDQRDAAKVFAGLPEPAELLVDGVERPRAIPVTRAAALPETAHLSQGALGSRYTLAGEASAGRRGEWWQEKRVVAGEASAGRRGERWQERRALAGEASGGRRDERWQERKALAARTLTANVQAFKAMPPVVEVTSLDHTSLHLPTSRSVQGGFLQCGRPAKHPPISLTRMSTSTARRTPRRGSPDGKCEPFAPCRVISSGAPEVNRRLPGSLSCRGAGG
jgi:hypothetical protein